MKTLKRFLHYYKPHKLVFTIDMLSALLIAAIGIMYPIITRTMLNDYIPDQNYKMIIICGSALLVLYLIRMLLNFVMQYYGHLMGVKMQAQMRTDLFNHLQKLPYNFYDNNETGKIMTRMTSDLFDVSELAHHGPESVIISSISVVASFIYLSTINIYLTLIIFSCVPFLFIITLILRKRMRSAFRKSREAVGLINASVESSISGIRVTKAFTNADKELQKFEVGNKEFVSARKSAYKAMAQFHSSNSFVTDIFNVIILIVGGMFLYSGIITELGDYTAFVVSVGLFITPIMTLINFTEQFQNGATGFERFLQIIDAEPEKDIENAIDLGRADGEIEFKNVTFAYEDNKTVLKNVDFKIKKGKIYALVGPSGGGKTTICHLIPRFYEIEKGQILIDGKDVRSVTAESLRKNIGIVQQDIYLFNASIKDNILYGNPNASEEEVVLAAKRANIHDFVCTLEDGYDTIIGERGVKLSGGQKQRLSIARVFLKNPPILILDEATSALDNVTELLIQKSLDELCRGRTTIVVAHRLTTIKNADEIAVVSNGAIVEQGTHDELVAKDGAYKKLHDGQFAETLSNM